MCKCVCVRVCVCVCTCESQDGRRGSRDDTSDSRWCSFRGKQGETLLRLFSGPHNVEANLEARNFFGVCARQAIISIINSN